MLGKMDRIILFHNEKDNIVPREFPGRFRISDCGDIFDKVLLFQPHTLVTSTINNDGIQIWDLRTCRCVFTLRTTLLQRVHRGYIRAMIKFDSMTILTAGGSHGKDDRFAIKSFAITPPFCKKVKEFRFNGGEVIRLYKLPGNRTFLDFPKGDLFISLSRSGDILLISYSLNRVIRVIGESLLHDDIYFRIDFNSEIIFPESANLKNCFLLKTLYYSEEASVRDDTEESSIKLIDYTTSTLLQEIVSEKKGSFFTSIGHVCVSEPMERRIVNYRRKSMDIVIAVERTRHNNKILYHFVFFDVLRGTRLCIIEIQGNRPIIDMINGRYLLANQGAKFQVFDVYDLDFFERAQENDFFPETISVGKALLAESDVLQYEYIKGLQSFEVIKTFGGNSVVIVNSGVYASFVEIRNTINPFHDETRRFDEQERVEFLRKDCKDYASQIRYVDGTGFSVNRSFLCL